MSESVYFIWNCLFGRPDLGSRYQFWSGPIPGSGKQQRAAQGAKRVEDKTSGSETEPPVPVQEPVVSILKNKKSK